MTLGRDSVSMLMNRKAGRRSSGGKTTALRPCAWPGCERHKVAAPVKIGELQVRDVVNLPPKSTTRIAWVPDGRPCSWMYHCHILEHHATGMMGHFDVVA